MGREQEPEKKSGNQSTHVRGHADLRSGNVECDLDGDDLGEDGDGLRLVVLSSEHQGDLRGLRTSARRVRHLRGLGHSSVP